MNRNGVWSEAVRVRDDDVESLTIEASAFGHCFRLCYGERMIGEGVNGRTMQGDGSRTAGSAAFSLPILDTAAEPLAVTELSFVGRLAHLDHGLRYLGPTLRGAFGFAFKDLVCQSDDGDCGRCPLSPACPFTTIFEGRAIDGRAILRKYPFVPQPFVLRVAAPGSWLGEPDEIRFSVRLFGGAGRWTPEVISAVQAMGWAGLGPGRVRCELIEVADRRGLIWTPREDQFLPPAAESAITREGPRDGRLRIRFHTPVHLDDETASGRRPLSPLEVILAGRRRWFLLTSLYGTPRPAEEKGERVESDEFRVVADDLQAWRIDRYSGRQKRTMPLWGVVGSMLVEGPWSKAGEWIRAIESVHLGKHVTFGFGRLSWEQA
jgi:hypothetical protein